MKRPLLLPSPHRQRLFVLNQNAFASDRRVRPGRTVCNGVLPNRRRGLVRRVGHNQVRVVGQREDRVARDHHRRVFALSPVARPERLPVIGVQTEELPFVAVRQAEEQIPGEHRRVHVHRDFPVLPHGVGRPFVVAPAHADGERAFVDAGKDQQVFVSDRRDDVLHVLGGERNLPEQPAVVGPDADDVLLRLRDDLPFARDLEDDRRRIAGAVAGPTPFLRAGFGVEGDHCAAPVATQRCDRESPIHNRRRCRAEIRDLAAEHRSAILAPFQFARRRVVTREHASDAERVKLAAAENRRGLRPFAVARRRRVHCVSDRIAVLPRGLSGFEIVSGHDFVLALPRVLVDAFAGDQRRRVAGPNRDLPLLLKLGGPGLRRDEARDRAVAIRAAPSRPILRESEWNHQQESEEQDGFQ